MLILIARFLIKRRNKRLADEEEKLLEQQREKLRIEEKMGLEHDVDV